MLTTPPSVATAGLEQWRAAAGIDSRTLHSHTRCGVSFRCLSTLQDLQAARYSGAVAPAPLPRRSGKRPWRVGQRHDHPDLATAAAMMGEDMDNEVDMLVLQWPQAVRRGSFASLPEETEQGGLAIASAEDLAALLPEDKPLPLLALDAGAGALPAAALLLAFAERRTDAQRPLRAFLGIDPLGALACGARLSSQRHKVAMADVALYVARHHPGVRALAVTTSAYHLAGASDVQELAFAMATGCAYVETLLAAGMDAESACAQPVFTLNADTDFFPQVAKFRAARILWRRISEAFGAGEGCAMQLQAESALRFLTRYAPYVNIIRTATAGCAAVVGSVDGLLLRPFSGALGVADVEARRIARNTHFLLSEEAMLGGVADAAEGSWSIDSLTRDMAEAAWRLFQDIARQGGMEACLRSGRVGELLRRQREWRARQIASGAARIVGINAHPNADEGVPAVCRIDASARRRALERVLCGSGRGLPRDGVQGFGALVRLAADGASLGELASALGCQEEGEEQAICLPRARESEAWEALRDKGAEFAARRGAPPGVFLLRGAGEAGGQWLADVRDLLRCAGMVVAGEAELTGGAGEVGAAFAESGALFVLAAIADAQERETSAAGAAAQDCLGAGAGMAVLWRRGADGAQDEIAPFSLMLGDDSDLPAAFARVYASF